MDAFIQSIGKMFDILFSDIGRKLQVLAKVCLGVSFIGLIGATIYFLIDLENMLDDYYYDVDLFDVIGGGYPLGCLMYVALTLVISWTLYAFGQLVDDIHQNRSVKKQMDDSYTDLPKL